MKISPYILALLLLLIFPSVAAANMGTPLMWVSMLHLAFGNALIGILEGKLLAQMYQSPKRKSIPLLILANYVSAWAGGFFLLGHLTSLPDITIQTVRFWFFVFLLAAFVLTLLIEYPFFWLALRPQRHSLRRALVATVMIHGISYTILLAWYWIASGTSIITTLEVVSAEELRVQEPYAAYFISADGNHVLRMDLRDPGSSTPISAVAAHQRNDRLFVRPKKNSGFDLFVFLESENGEKGTELKLLDDFATLAPLDQNIANGYSNHTKGSWFNYGPVPRVAPKSDWKFHTGFWPGEGLSGDNAKTKQTIQYSLETPFVVWRIRNATHLAGDLVLFQLGDDQICILHPKSGEIALLARGKGPIAAKPKAPPAVSTRENTPRHARG